MSRNRKPKTKTIAARVSWAVAEHVRRCAEKRGKTTQEFLISRLRKFHPDWPWDVVTPPDAAENTTDATPAPEPDAGQTQATETAQDTESANL